MTKLPLRLLFWTSTAALAFACAKADGGGADNSGGDGDGDDTFIPSGSGGMTLPPSTGGASTASGVGGTGTGSGGAPSTGGMAGIDPDVIKNADLIIRATYEPNNFHFFLENKGEVALPLGALEVRYWYEATATVTTLRNYYTGGDLTTVTWTAAETSGEKYAAATFAPGNLPVNEGNYAATEFQLQLENGNHVPTGDWSYSSTLGNFGITDKVTAYLEDTLVWGCEPTGVCAGDDGMGGGGGEGSVIN